MTEIIKKLYDSRLYENGDEISLVNLYNTVTGRSRTIDQYRWEWLDTPQGQGSIWVIEEKKTAEIVGHHGLIPIKLSYFGRSISAGKTENTMIHPVHKGKILYFMFEKQFIGESKDNYDLLYTTMGSGTPGRIRKKLGYVKIGSYALYLKITQKSGLDKLTEFLVNKKVKNKILCCIFSKSFKFFNHFFRLLFVRNTTMDLEVKLNQVKSLHDIHNEVNRLWQRTKSELGITIIRDFDYLNWRLFNNPNTHYDFFSAIKSNQLVGYSAVKYGMEGEAIIVDIIADKNDKRLFDSILQKTIDKLKDKGIQIILFPTLFSHNSLNCALKRNGFRSFTSIYKYINRLAKKEVSFFLVKILNDKLDEVKFRSPEKWYFTGIFGEGLKHSYSLIGFLKDL